MLEIALGSALIYYFATEAFEIEKKPPGTVYYTETADSRNLSFRRNHIEPVQIKPAVEDQFRGIVRQAYDYSCGSAALTTLLNGYVGTSLTEQQTMSGLLQYGEYQRIIERRSFSLLDMKRFVTAIGLDSGGYRGEFSDLVNLGQPAIVPISYAGFKHFVVYKAYKDGRVYVADPALGNISFDENRFKEVWDNNTLFVVSVPESQRKDLLALKDSDMRHVEDATVNRYAFVDVQYPTFNYDRLANKASTMRRVLDKDPNSATYNQPIETYMRLYYKRK
ncbi:MULTISPECIES: C39 family peptidase [Acinetobacter]|jgi:predicted double-glycine peptidase|uniref:Peptidase C39, bacteriocin processing n=4 Tax=Acinetobacter pittii TaxID=48296 RepID=F0KNH6_ACIP2|nr:MULTISPECIES: C39 family peptidase [Acinetobacter]YP_004997808.1 peptidase C39, bacteriocin processing [Acinetobacter pittii PHEA-2]MDR0070091.1 C39 family peptidase [Acinetobacter sp. 11520]TDM61113.1 peptidase [Acinetobacter sp. KU 011TH]TDM61247.1 peptidase [Acinetobacter sp. KU 013TH]ADY84126.1 peptidase C39, bacteriocin processing [Acinetobacter pittii PHEA-2]AMM28513.1 peptidase [Acinetobacter pittii]